MILSPNDEPLPGYRLVRCLGEGGFGEAWEAVNGAGLHVALKFLNLDSTNAQHEVKALEAVANIRHPNLVPIHDIRPLNRCVVVVMTLCESNLLQRLQDCVDDGDEGIPREELVGYMADVAKALDWLNAPRHRSPDGKLVGVQHRDVKPQNIFLQSETAVLGDYGIARIMERTQILTGHIHGTVCYAPPEFFKREVAATSDQWSLAVTYCHLATARLPFTGPSMLDFIQQIANDEPDLRPFPVAERAVLERALSKAPKARYGSCRDFVEALRSAVLLPAPAGMVSTRDRRGSETARTELLGPKARAMAASTPNAANNDTAKTPEKSWRPQPKAAPSRVLPAVAGMAVVAAAVVLAVLQPWNDIPREKDAAPDVVRNEGLEKAATTEANQDTMTDAAKKVAKSSAATKATDKLESKVDPPLPQPPANIVVRFRVNPVDAEVVSDDAAVVVAGTGLERTATFAPGLAKELPLRVRAKGYRESTFRVGAAAAKNAAQTVRLEPLPVRIDVQADPPDVSVTVVGAKHRREPGSNSTIWIDEPRGEEVELRFGGDGLIEQVRKVTATPGATIPVGVRLEAVSSTIELTVSPANAEVATTHGQATIEGAGGTRRVVVKSRAVSAEIELKASESNHESWRRTVSLRRGETLPLTVALTPMPAIVTFDVEPADAQLSLSNGGRIEAKGGRWIARFGPNGPNELYADFTVEATRVGYRTARRTFRPVPGGDETIALRLAEQPSQRKLTLAAVGMEMVLVPAGRFQAGSAESPEDVVRQFPSELEEDFQNEHPVHRVTLQKATYFGATEVTVGQFRRFVRATNYETDAERKIRLGTANAKEANPTGAADQTDLRPWHTPAHDSVEDDHPVTHVSLNDARAFCRWLSNLEGRTVRLPLQEEWEYACRAGTTTRYWCGDDPESLLGNANVPDASHMAWNRKRNENSFDRWFFKYRLSSRSFNAAPAAPPSGAAPAGPATVGLPWIARYGLMRGVTLRTVMRQETRNVQVQLADGTVESKPVNETIIDFESLAEGGDGGVTLVNSFEQPVEVKIDNRVLTIPAGEQRDFEPIPQNKGKTLAILGDDGYPNLAPVRKFRANPFGLFDMHGNVWEWCDSRFEPYDRSPVIIDRAAIDAARRTNSFAQAVPAPAPFPDDEPKPPQPGMNVPVRDERYVIRGGCFT